MSVTSLRHCYQSDGMLREIKTPLLQKIPLEMITFTHHSVFIIILTNPHCSTLHRSMMCLMTRDWTWYMAIFVSSSYQIISEIANHDTIIFTFVNDAWKEDNHLFTVIHLFIFTESSTLLDLICGASVFQRTCRKLIC